MSTFSRSLSACRSIEAMQREHERAERIGTGIVPAQAPFDPFADITLLERVALLGMLNSTIARGVARRIAGLEDCQDRPTWADYRALAQKGLCERDPVEPQYHQLTIEGRSKAQALLAKLCQLHAIHIMQETKQTDQTLYRCSCGCWSKILNGHGMHQFRRAQSSFAAHVPRPTAESA